MLVLRLLVSREYTKFEVGDNKQGMYGRTVMYISYLKLNFN